MKFSLLLFVAMGFMLINSCANLPGVVDDEVESDANVQTIELKKDSNDEDHDCRGFGRGLFSSSIFLLHRLGLIAIH